MSLLREIQAAATDSSAPITDLLLRCQLLASRLNYEPLRVWVEKELNGYDQDDELPDYRKLGGVDVLGTLQGPWSSGGQNVPIPITIVDEKHRDRLFTSELRGGISGYEHLTAATDSLSESWPAHYVQYYGQRPLNDAGMHLIEARKVIPKGAIVSALATVRSRVLTLALEVERQNPDAGEAVAGVQPLPSAALQSITQHVYGQASIVAPAGDVGSQTMIRDVTSGGDVVTGTQTVGRDKPTRSVVAGRDVRPDERNWFARHPWISGIAIGGLTSVLPAVYLVRYGLSWPW